MRPSYPIEVVVVCIGRLARLHQVVRVAQSGFHALGLSLILAPSVFHSREARTICVVVDKDEVANPNGLRTVVARKVVGHNLDGGHPFFLVFVARVEVNVHNVEETDGVVQKVDAQGSTFVYLCAVRTCGRAEPLKECGE